VSVRKRESPSNLWVLIFVLLSLLAHVAIITAILLITLYMPPPEIVIPPDQDNAVSLSLMKPPPPPPHPIFLPTSPDPTAVHKDTLIQSDNDTTAKSESKQSRAPDSVMPDIVSKKDRPFELKNSPNSPSTQKPQQAASTPPTPKHEPQKQQPQKQSKQPPTDKPPTPTEVTTTPPKPTPPTKQPPPPTLDPNGLPVLPPLNVPTMAPQVTVNPNQVSQAPIPPPLVPSEASDVQGRAGMSGAPSPEAMSTELGKYKAKVYLAVGSRWYQKVGQQLSLLGVGSVHVQYTIHSDGTVDVTVLDGGTGSLQLLLSLSQNSILEAAPFEPFSPALIKELGGATSFTDDFTFSIYSGG
jgi:cytoskeletal protein RodZ